MVANEVKKSVSSLFPKFPFAIGIPERVLFYDMPSVIKYINDLNGRVRIFASLYTARNNPPLEKIWFDLDSDKSYENALHFHKYCQSRNLLHSIVFSGGGFHIYIYTKNYESVQDSKLTLLAVHKEIAHDLGMTIGKAHESDLDESIIGDIQRIVTVPGTFNCKRKRWSISLTKDELLSGLDNIHKLSEKQRHGMYVMGSDYLDLAQYKDIKVEYFNVAIPELKAREDKITDETLLEFPPCVQKILLNEDGFGDWRGRWIFTIWSKELGFSKEQTDEIAKKYFSQHKRTDYMKNNYTHYHKVKVIDYVYRNDSEIPNCEKMWLEHKCVGKCEWYIKSRKQK